ncbi:MAG: NADH-quinone oxidoreductase subunit M, partial [Deltaproteobacteria bacterium]
LFYVFWEAVLIPMYLIVGVWGGERRIYAAVKFFIFTMVGSLLMFLAILYCYQSAGGETFELQTLYEKLKVLSAREQFFLFGAFALSFAIKVPMFPLHTWLPDAHVEAPTAGSVILAGVLLKMGTYGILRFAMPFFPKALFYTIHIPIFGEANFLGFLTVLSVIGIIYGALMALAQDDIKKLIAYSSVSHMGFVMLGLLALNLQGVTGGVYQMLNHGLSTGALFLLVGMLYERRHTREIVDYGGIAKKVPVYSAIFMIVTLSSIGLPGTNGFVGEFTILLGMFQVDPWYAIVAASGVILGAVYMLWMVQRVFFGRLTNPDNEKLQDVNRRELVILVPIVILIFVMGIFPNLFFRKMEPSIRNILETVKVNSQYEPPSAERPAAPER